MLPFISSPSTSFMSTGEITTTTGVYLSPLTSVLKKESCGVSGVMSFANKKIKKNAGIAVMAATKTVTGLQYCFEPFEEVKKELRVVPTSPHLSLARQNYSDMCEAGINEQINVEYSVSYVYHAMYAYFDRDNVALKGIAKFFKDSSLEEREHAEKFIEYQNKRGGKVKLQSMLKPLSEFYHADKGDALYAMELALSLERLNNEKLQNLHKLASDNNDLHLMDFVESEFLTEQVESIKKLSEYVAQLRRLGKGHDSSPVILVGFQVPGTLIK
ncbi:Enoyl-CoA isomerase/hydratase fer4 [Turnera subulata]|uniref:Ferritin n=1 Tax=Turnera subulata TaxID=218843 RepID=A0A9Q0JH57_9ROSI|nr:Enoyl-CoA isomerase/hydratase fer4 [Turnera subulata]